MIVKMTILRLLGPKDLKIEETVKKPSQNNQDRDILVSSVEPTLRKLHTSVHWLGARLRAFGNTGWTDARKVEYVSAMNSAAEAKSIHRINQR